MPSQAHQEKLAAQILRVSFESLTLEDFGRDGMPLLERLLETSNSVLYRCQQRQNLSKMGGTMEDAHFRYTEHYYASDPMQSLMRRTNPWILHGRRHSEWKKFLKLPVYRDHARRYGIDNYIHVRLNEAGHNEPGMAGMVLARAARQPDFSDHEGLLLTRMIPALEALVRRSDRMEEHRAARSVVEALVEMDPVPKIALNTRGRLLWISERAAALLEWRPGARWTPPRNLIQAARALGALSEKNPGRVIPPPHLSLAGLRAELRLARRGSGEPFILVELRPTPLSSPLTETAARFQLTPAEVQVLRLMASGLSDREIGQSLFIAMPTVRTHAGRILSKLGVKSRVQAALMSHGLRTSPDSTLQK